MHLRRSTPLALAAVLAIAAAACGTTPTPGPTSAGPTAVTSAPASGTFETAWGTAWDGLPAGFPVPDGAEPAEPGDPAEGPVSGAFVVTGRPEQVVKATENALGAAGYSTLALDGPLEDGDYVLDSLGSDPACRVQTRVRALGGTTMMSVLYGAACPWG